MGDTVSGLKGLSPVAPEPSHDNSGATGGSCVYGRDSSILANNDNKTNWNLSSFSQNFQVTEASREWGTL